MANELLDFVMSLVRDPDAAARYAADPAGALADAQLTNVTSADVNNLIPMVSDSLSMAAPAVGVGDVADGNVWTSGAATAAFDAFTPHVPDIVSSALHDVPGGVIDPGLVSGVGATDLDLTHSVPTVDDFTQFSDVVQGPLDDLGMEDSAGWDQGVIEVGHDTSEHPGFDLF